jgi:hypothetical protein
MDILQYHQPVQLLFPLYSAYWIDVDVILHVVTPCGLRVTAQPTFWRNILPAVYVTVTQQNTSLLS